MVPGVIPVRPPSPTTSSNSSQSGFSDPSNIVCKDYTQQGSGQTWLLQDLTTGFWDAKFGFGFIPTVLRLYNTDYQGRGTKTFRMIALPLNGIMNLTYTDSTGTVQSCTADCPLPQGNTTAQDFHLVNTVGMNEVRIEFMDWYGDGAGLNGIELLETDLYSFAISDFNEPACNGNGVAASATTTGPWTETPSGSSDSDYLTASFTSGDITSDSAQVVFMPDIKESGNYTITMFTPGCIGDNTCSSRGSANVTGRLSPNGATFTTTVTQTTDYDKYDQIYYGPVDVTSSSFRPTVTLTPMAGQNVPLTLGAQRIRFVLVDSTGGLNGLFEYNPNLATIDTDFSSSAIDSAGMALADGAVMNAMAVIGNNLYVGGNFTSGGTISGLNNIMSIGSNNATALPGSGLNNAVEVIYQNGSTLYVGGNFTSTTDGSVKNLNGLAAFSNHAWSALGAGVNGTVSAIVPLQVNVTAGNLQDCLAVSGSFGSVNSFQDNSSFDASGIAIWVISSNNWLHNVASSRSTMQGALNAYTSVPNNSPLWAGSVSSQSMATSDAVALFSSGEPSLVTLGASIGLNDSIVEAEASNMLLGNISGAVTGVFIENGNVNVTAIGGHFTANTTTGTIYNFALLSNSNTSGLPSTINANSTVLTMDNTDTTLYIGGEIQGTSGSNTVGGFLVYDLTTYALANTQPPALNGGNEIVNSVVVQPGSGNVFVGGDFAQAGSLSCATLCMWNSNTAQWMAAGVDLSGVVTSMMWTSNTHLVLAGNLTVGVNQTTMLNYDASSQTYSQFPGASALPGPVTDFSPATSDYSQFWAVGTAANNGSSYLQRYNGSSWIPVTGFGSNSVIRSAQVMSTTSSHTATSLLSKNEVLLLTGAIEVPGFGNASAVLFNGTTYQPFLLSNTADNGQGSIAKLFVQYPGNFMSSSGESGFPSNVDPVLTYHRTPPCSRIRCTNSAGYCTRLDLHCHCRRHTHGAIQAQARGLHPHEATQHRPTGQPGQDPAREALWQHRREERHRTQDLITHSSTCFLIYPAFVKHKQRLRLFYVTLFTASAFISCTYRRLVAKCR